MTKDEFKELLVECLQEEDIELDNTDDALIVTVWWDKDRKVSDQFFLRW